LGLAAVGGSEAGGGTATGFLDSTSAALIPGGARGTANSTNVGCVGSAAGSVGGSAVGRFKSAMGGAGAASTGGASTGAASTGAAFADSTSERTRESIVSPAGMAGSSSAITAVSIATDECPLVNPNSRYCSGAAESNGTAGTARSCSTIDNTPLVTDNAPLVTPACPCAQEGHSRTAGEQSRPQSGQIQHNIY
jgi:hypothetical protein